MPLKKLASLFVGLVALEHMLILVMEMFLWTTVGARVFKLSSSDAALTAPMAMNQGLYNGFLAAGLVWALLAAKPERRFALSVFFLGCVVIAGVFGAMTVKWSIVLTQALPASIALVLVFISRRRSIGE